jgi:hypothetical protein
VKPIVARSQVVLGPGRCLELALSGMRYRMFRSGVTIAILALAVAFLVHMLTYGLLAGQTERNARAELSASRVLGEQLTRLGTADPPAKIKQVLASGDARRLAEYQRWAELGPEELQKARAVAEELASVTLALSALSPASSAILLGDLTPHELLAALETKAVFSAFEHKVGELGLGRQVGDLSRLRRLVSEGLPELERAVLRVQAGHREAIARATQLFEGKPVEATVAEPPPDLYKKLAEAGFTVEGTPEELARFARGARDEKRIAEALLDPDVRSQVARELNVLPKDVDLARTFSELGSGKKADWLASVLGKQPNLEALDGARIAELARAFERRGKLEAIIDEQAPVEGEDFFGLPERLRWLIALSFLVCVVGVANAMLMSVTERFTEIATMKCLGAMDGFVMLMFVIEAGVQGVVGGVAGAVLGILLAALRGAAEYGGLFFATAGVLVDVGLAVLVSFVVGVLLAALAAVGPSFVAARLSPMEAMRVE